MRRKKKVSLSRKLLWLSSLSGIVIFVIFVWAIIDVITAKDSEIQVFTGGDGLLITADSYLAHDTATAPFIVLFHQGSWSRGEFLEIAPRLNKMGYNCLAVDLRSGNKIRGVENLTAIRARELGKRVRFSDAMQDVITALNFVKHKYNPPKLLVLGSSYSAGLALKAAGDYPGLVDGVLAFSPGEYFVKDGKPYNWVAASAAKITVPVLIASARAETIRWASIYEAIDTDSKLSYTPSDNGEHGARSLWERYEDSRGYWAVMETFLKGYFLSRY